MEIEKSACSFKNTLYMLNATELIQEFEMMTLIVVPK